MNAEFILGHQLFNTHFNFQTAVNAFFEDQDVTTQEKGTKREMSDSPTPETSTKLIKL